MPNVLDVVAGGVQVAQALTEHGAPVGPGGVADDFLPVGRAGQMSGQHPVEAGQGARQLAVIRDPPVGRGGD